MLASLLKRPIVLIPMLGLFAFVLVSILGLGHTLGMGNNQSGDMEGCIFTGSVMLCKMNILEHITLWQNMFIADPSKVIFVVMLMALLTAIIFAINRIIPRLRDIETTVLPKLSFPQYADLVIVTPLKQAFSQGILHPKIYEFLTL